MASHVSKQRTVPTEFPDTLSRNTQGSAQNSSAWELKLGLKSVALLWSSMAGLLLAAFLFGLYAGRDQGLNYYLNANAREPVRFPMLLASEENKNILNEDYRSIAAQAVSAGTTSAPVEAASETQSSAVATPPAAEPKPVAPKEEAKSVETPPTSKEKKIEEKAPSPAKANIKIITAPELTKVQQTPAVSSKSETPKPVVQQQLSKGWYVQVAVAKNVEEAVSVVDTLRAHGMSGIIQPGLVRNAFFYRVVTGPFDSKEGANKKEEEINSAHLVTGKTFVRLSN